MMCAEFDLLLHVWSSESRTVLSIRIHTFSCSNVPVASSVLASLQLYLCFPAIVPDIPFFFGPLYRLPSLPVSSIEVAGGEISPSLGPPKASTT